MGRGRAKAKQTKVARELKYNTAGMTDLERLAAELAAGGGVTPRAVEPVDDEDDDPYAKYVEDEDEDEDGVPAPADRTG